MNRQTQLLQYLQDELALSKDDLSLALKLQDNSATKIPIVLWQYGLLSLEQLDQIYDWLATV